jgi:hypothetical protein
MSEKGHEHEREVGVPHGSLALKCRKSDRRVARRLRANSRRSGRLSNPRSRQNLVTECRQVDSVFTQPSLLPYRVTSVDRSLQKPS